MSALKQCPFCGGTASLDYSDGIDAYQYRCGGCGTAAPEWSDDVGNAAACWNCRVEDRVIAELRQLIAAGNPHCDPVVAAVLGKVTAILDTVR